MRCIYCGDEISQDDYMRCKDEHCEPGQIGFIIGTDIVNSGFILHNKLGEYWFKYELIPKEIVKLYLHIVTNSTHTWSSYRSILYKDTK
jgi:hypothetical protein